MRTRIRGDPPHGSRPAGVHDSKFKFLRGEINMDVKAKRA